MKEYYFIVFKLWGKINKSSYPPIEGKLVTLKPFRFTEMKQLRKWFKDEDLLRLAFGVSADSMVLAKMGKEYLRDIFLTDREILAIHINEGSIGFVSFSVQEGDEKIARIGLLIGEEKNRGKGYGSDAVNALLKYLFTVRKVERIELDTAIFNTQAQRCFIKCGFKKTGEIAAVNFLDGKVIQKILMQINREEFMKDG